MNPLAAAQRDFTPAKPVCPFCRSDQVTTLSQFVTEVTYWSCDGCGEVWNQSRLLSFTARR
jgi:transposase-like protein